MFPLKPQKISKRVQKTTIYFENFFLSNNQLKFSQFVDQLCQYLLFM